jgi:hypothetical protein
MIAQLGPFARSPLIDGEFANSFNKRFGLWDKCG